MQIKKTFNSKLDSESLFKAWISSDMTIEPICKIECNPIVGGDFVLHAQSENGIQLMKGQFKEVVQNQKLSYSWKWEGDTEETQVEVLFESIKKGCKVQLFQGDFLSEESKRLHEIGWEDYFNKLENKIIHNDNPIEFAGVSDRIKAAVVDSIVLLPLMMAILSYGLSQFDAGGKSRMLAFIFLFGLYDPLSTSLFGGTLGHLLFSIRVRRAKSPKENIFFPLAFIRYLGKISLGWVSLLTIGGDEKNQAIHDMIIGSIVIKK